MYSHLTPCLLRQCVRSRLPILYNNYMMHKYVHNLSHSIWVLQLCTPWSSHFIKGMIFMSDACMIYTFSHIMQRLFDKMYTFSHNIQNVGVGGKMYIIMHIHCIFIVPHF